MSKPPKTIGSRFIKGRKQDALKEIEGWIAETRAETIKVGASRPAFQTSKNITEQKMLDCKLYDMSKQRFNFVVQCQWQRKLFLEKQRKKTSIMHDLLRNVDVTAINENPFLKNKPRRATVIPANRTILPSTIIQQKASTTLPGRRRTSTDTMATIASRDHPIFVTQKERFLPNINEDARSNKSSESRFIGEVDDANSLPAAGANTTSLSTNQIQRWPMTDSRLTRLSASLSDSYPKYVPLRSQKAKLNFSVPAY